MVFMCPFFLEYIPDIKARYVLVCYISGNIFYGVHLQYFKLNKWLENYKHLSVYYIDDLKYT